MRFLIRLLADLWERPEPIPPLPRPNEISGLDLILEINRYRQRHRLPALVEDTRLAFAAGRQASHVANLQRVTHTGPNGETLRQRLLREGWPTTNSSCAENVAAGYSSAISVVAAWSRSAEHRANLLGAYDLAGCAAVQNGTWYACAVLGRVHL